MVHIPFFALAPLAALVTGTTAAALESREASASASEPFYSVVLYSDRACSVTANVPLIQITKSEACIIIDDGKVNSFQFVLSGGSSIKNSVIRSYDGKGGCNIDNLVHNVPGKTYNQGTCYINNVGPGATPLKSFNAAKP